MAGGKAGPDEKDLNGSMSIMFAKFLPLAFPWRGHHPTVIKAKLCVAGFALDLSAVMRSKTGECATSRAWS